MIKIVYNKPMKYYQKIFDYLAPIAIQSNEGWARLASAVVYKGKIISTGVNSLKSHPFQKKYSRNSESIFWHAENSSIHIALRNLDTSDLSGCDLYVYRAKKYDMGSEYITGLAKPCTGCMSCIIRYNISNVFYTMDGDGNFKKQFACLGS